MSINQKINQYITLDDQEAKADDITIGPLLYDEQINHPKELSSLFSNTSRSVTTKSKNEGETSTNSNSQTKEECKKKNENENLLIQLRPKVRKGKLIMCCFNKKSVPRICIGPDCKFKKINNY